jgi:hypothetical protein
MTQFEPVDEYASVDKATDDILTRIKQLPGEENWLAEGFYYSLVPEWTDTLTGFQANVTVSTREKTHLEQIIHLYEEAQAQLEKQAAVIGSGRMATLDPSHVLFIVLFRDLQQRAGVRTNMNPHKLRVILDERYDTK